MAQDIVKKSGSPIGYRDDRGGAVLIPHPVIGIVKDNIDPTHSGRIKVYIGRFGGSNPDDVSTWRTVKYLSPYFGMIAPGYDVYNGPDRSGYGSFKGNPHSYGFWASAPDIGTQVICVFINGDPQDGYYIGCVPTPGLTHMVPAIAASSEVVPNASEAESIAGGVRLPVTEVNYTNPGIRNSSRIYDLAKPVHSYQASVLLNQGLIRDNLRGVIGSSSQRETPSRVFGISTPGQAIYSGGFTRATLDAAAQTSDSSKLQVVGRTGGHSIVMDDGDIKGQDQLMRLRTSGGHMLMMNDSGQVLTIIHSNGQSYIELGKEGTIDLYSTNSVNVRTEGDLNFHADRDVNINAKRNLNLYGSNVKVESDQNTEIRAGASFLNYAQVNYSLKVEQNMSLQSTGVSAFGSSQATYITGQPIYLNTGNTGFIPQTVAELTKINHVDTTYSPSKGWINPSPDPLLSIASRAPAHMPWVGANRGVDVVTGSVQPAAPVQPTTTVQAVNQNSPSVPDAPTNTAVLSTAPTIPTPPSSQTSNVLPSSTIQGLVSQQAVLAQTASAAEKVTLGIAEGMAGATYAQLQQPGQSMKPGAGNHALALQNIAPWLATNQRVPPTLLTGTGARTAQDLASNKVQIPAIAQSLVNSATELKNAGIITGKESPTQVGGIIFATANLGVNAVKGAVASVAQIGANISNFGKLVSSGNFAAGLTDKATAGLSGLANSLNNMSNGALGAISTGITNYAREVGGKLSGLLNSLRGAAQNAYSLAEKSFGSLQANVPNSLSGGTAIAALSNDPNIKLLTDLKAAQEELIQVEKELVAARRDYRNEPSEDSLNKIRESENRVAATQQKVTQLNKQILQSGTDLVGRLSAQTANTVTNALASGSVNAPNPTNTGINAIVGGVGAFVSQVGGKVSNMVGSLKTLAQGTGDSIAKNLANPNAIVGNLVGNTKQALASIGNAAGAVSGSISSLANSAANSAVSNTIKTNMAALSSNITSLTSGIGNSPGGVKPATLAEKTYTVTEQMRSKAGSLVGPGVPIPNFDAADYTAPASTVTAEQINAQQEINALQTRRALLAVRLDTAIQKYDQTKNPEQLKNINTLNEFIADTDAKIAAAQQKYNTYSSNQAI